MMMKNNWIPCSERFPDDYVFVLTKIDDDNGIRNVQELKRSGSLWFMDNGMYVYYRPTHWMPLPEPYEGE